MLLISILSIFPQPALSGPVDRFLQCPKQRPDQHRNIRESIDYVPMQPIAMQPADLHRAVQLLRLRLLPRLFQVGEPQHMRLPIDIKTTYLEPFQVASDHLDRIKNMPEPERVVRFLHRSFADRASRCREYKDRSSCR